MAASRMTRIGRYLRALPLELWRLYPEQVALFSTFGVAAAAVIVYKLRKYGTEGVQPYYRGQYEVVRPNDPIALNWRPPEDYPAPYLSNRENSSAATYRRDYGWKSLDSWF
ncbi:Uncharacterized protein K12H4.5 [Toxocara canis]|uniref:Uncharacterized protein K12H4.5 n=1 Tax=Toxocara canis TaxID=6265 RepID=A0A0B2V155_TOXCA|nr:Uncharacterized protein K12H4.5 [Toxocara canis]